MFDIGDVVICNKLDETFNPGRKGQVATILGFRLGRRFLILSAPFRPDLLYGEEAFDLYEPTLENK